MLFQEMLHGIISISLLRTLGFIPELTRYGFMKFMNITLLFRPHRFLSYGLELVILIMTRILFTMLFDSNAPL